MTAALESWVCAACPDELRAALTAEQVLLFSDEAATQMGALLAPDPVDPALLVRAGLLALCRSAGIDAAFRLLVDDDLRRPIPGAEPSPPWAPARARLRAGMEPDDPDAAFVHAVLASAQ